MLNKYNLLVKILDGICKEAPSTRKTYELKGKSEDEKNNIRSKAFIHLFLKVKYGILDFEEREKLITDGSNDGGIDAYYIDNENKVINIIQSKFRTNENNFENKDIDLTEIAKMDIKRITQGELCSETGEEYNGKIKGFQRNLKETKNIGLFDYKVILLSNLTKYTPEKISEYLGRFAVEVFDYNKTYNDLLFPLLKATYYDQENLNISLHLENKISSKLEQDIVTKEGVYILTILLAPAKEIGRVMAKYKNSLLQYNPRCYLSLAKDGVNEGIKKTIEDYETGEFALFNNGITIFAEACGATENSGEKNKGVLSLFRPQIINGGQTAFTLSRIYESNTQKKLEGKEVILKIISKYKEAKYLDNSGMIKNISRATNSQNNISESDMVSNEPFQIKLQEEIFNKFGLIYERKSGEFNDAIKNGYIKSTDLLNKEKLLRIYLSYKGEASIKNASNDKLFRSEELEKYYDDMEDLNGIIISYRLFNEIEKYKKIEEYKMKNAIRYGRNSILSAYRLKYKFDKSLYDFSLIEERIKALIDEWDKFELFIQNKKENEEVLKKGILSYYKTKQLDKDLEEYFGKEVEK